MLSTHSPALAVCAKLEELWGENLDLAEPERNETVVAQPRERAINRHPRDTEQIGQGFLAARKGQTAVRRPSGFL